MPRLVDIDGDLIMLANCTKNSLEICKLELTSQEPRLHTVCFLELPALEPYAFVVVSRVDKEWVPTSPHGARSQQQQQQQQPQPLPRKRVVPFRSSKVGTIGLLVEHEMRSASVRVLPSCWMTVSIAALLSTIGGGGYSSSDSDSGDAAAGVRTLLWPEWGPAATRVLLSSHGGRLPKPAGPFWIASFSPLVIRDYDLLRMRSTPAAAVAEEVKEKDKSSSRSLFGPPVFKSSEVPGEHWVGGKVESHLPYRDLVARELYCVGVVADREWIIRISVRVRFVLGVRIPGCISLSALTGIRGAVLYRLSCRLGNDDASLHINALQPSPRLACLAVARASECVFYSGMRRITFLNARYSMRQGPYLLAHMA